MSHMASQARKWRLHRFVSVGKRLGLKKLYNSDKSSPTDNLVSEQDIAFLESSLAGETAFFRQQVARS